MNTNWNCTFGALCLRLIWLLVYGAALLGALRLCAWADTGSKGECPIEQNIIPKEVKP